MDEAKRTACLYLLLDSNLRAKTKTIQNLSCKSAHMRKNKGKMKL
jgi:hypothetical protein